MNKSFHVGRLGKDAEIKTTDQGKKFMVYSIAVDTGTKEQPSTLWIDAVQWGEKTGVAPYLKKGVMVAVTGEPGIRVYQKNDGTAGGSFTLRVDKVELLGSKGENVASTGNTGSERVATTSVASDISESSEELPF